MTEPAQDIRVKPFDEALKERYLSYALSTIMSRSLPDVRDGLKPVHRRLLYAMRQLRLDPNSGYKKAARVVGDVIGKYHPHGDQAVYDALVRLAQAFAARYPLVDGQGNFGNIDGDNAAAMRYTEARLTDVAEALLDGIDQDAVDFRDTYDGEEREPVVLPAAFPNLLANGATGIAVGMATAIPPHNAAEICAALLWLVGHRETPEDKAIGPVLERLPAPDFPTGGILVESQETIREAYRTGRGGFRLRARWTVEKLKGGTYQIVVTEIPYQVQKARLVEKIAELLQARKLALLADVRDESTDDIRLVLEPKSRSVEPDVLMEALFRQTDLESRISLNMNVLDAEQTPRVMSLVEVLRAFLDHRHVVLQRRTEHRLAAIAKRLEVVRGYLVVFLNIDEVIRIIREEDHPKDSLIATFDLSDVQAEAILNMRLRALRKLEEDGLRKEHDALVAEQEDLTALLGDEGRRWKTIGTELKDIRKRFGEKHPWGPRRTELAGPPDAVVVPLEAVIEREPVTVICSEQGWIRAVRGHLTDPTETKYKEGDGPRFCLPCHTTDKLVLFASNGRFYTLGVDKLPGGRGHGEPLRMQIELPSDHDIIDMFVSPAGGRPGGERPGPDRATGEPGPSRQALAPAADGRASQATEDFGPVTRYLLASSDGRGFLVDAADVLAQTRTGKQILNLAAGATALTCIPVPSAWAPVGASSAEEEDAETETKDGAPAGDETGADPDTGGRSSPASVAVLGHNGKLLVFNLAEIPDMTRGRGVILQRFAKGGGLLQEGLAAATVFDAAGGLVWVTEDGKRRVEKDVSEWRGRRGGAGRKAPKAFAKKGGFA